MHYRNQNINKQKIIKVAQKTLKFFLLFAAIVHTVQPINCMHSIQHANQTSPSHFNIDNKILSVCYSVLVAFVNWVVFNDKMGVRKFYCSTTKASFWFAIQIEFSNFFEMEINKLSFYFFFVCGKKKFKLSKKGHTKMCLNQLNGSTVFGKNQFYFDNFLNGFCFFLVAKAINDLAVAILILVPLAYTY